MSHKRKLLFLFSISLIIISIGVLTIKRVKDRTEKTSRISVTETLPMPVRCVRARSGPVQPGQIQFLSNLEIGLQNVDPALASKALYAKAVRCGPNASDPCEVRFTSISPEIAAYLQAHLQYAAH